MKFVETPLPGLFVVELETSVDERGSFATSFCAREFAAQGLNARVAQCNISLNARAGTLRGLHFQVPPHEEQKLVRCTRGASFDVAVDVRERSPTYLCWHAVELTPYNGRMFFIPCGFAHGFQALADETEVSYLMFDFYRPESARGLRWDDPALAISWPLPNPILSKEDRAYPLLSGARRGGRTTADQTRRSAGRGGGTA